MAEEPILVVQDARSYSHLINDIIIACVGVFVFSPCLFNFFVSDDFYWISRGVNLTLDNFVNSFQVSTYNIFRPLVPVFFFALHQIFKLSPSGYHLTSIVLHILNSILFYHILLHFSLRKEISLFSAVLFVSHFAHEETVFWISSNCVLCSWFFSLSSILTFVKWLKGGKTWFYFLSLGLAVIALLFREDALFLPFILSLIVWLLCFRSKAEITGGLNEKRLMTRIMNLTPFFVLIIVYLFLRSLSLPDLYFGTLFSFNPVNIVRNFAYFLVNLIFPTRFIFDAIGYHHSRTINFAVNNIDSNIMFLIIGSLIIIFSILLFFRILRKANRDSKLLVAIFFIAIFPCLFSRGYSLRFSYLPLLGFVPIASYVLLLLFSKIRRCNLKLEIHHLYLYTFLTCLVLFSFLILFERNIWWSKASRICEDTISKAESVISKLPVGFQIGFKNLPTRLHGAYILNNGFVEAMGLFYPIKQHDIMVIESGVIDGEKEENEDNHFVFKYVDGVFYQIF